MNKDMEILQIKTDILKQLSELEVDDLNEFVNNAIQTAINNTKTGAVGKKDYTTIVTIPKGTTTETLSKLVQWVNMSASSIRVHEAAYNWIISGGALVPRHKFIHWDDDFTNNKLDNIFPVLDKIQGKYVAAKRDMPKGDVTLNKNLFRRIILEEKIDGYKC